MDLSVLMCPQATSREEFYLGCRVQRRWRHGNLKNAQWPLREAPILKMNLVNAVRVPVWYLVHIIATISVYYNSFAGPNG